MSADGTSVTMSALPNPFLLGIIGMLSSNSVKESLLFNDSELLFIADDMVSATSCWLLP